MTKPTARESLNCETATTVPQEKETADTMPWGRAARAPPLHLQIVAM